MVPAHLRKADKMNTLITLLTLVAFCAVVGFIVNELFNFLGAQPTVTGRIIRTLFRISPETAFYIVAVVLLVVWCASSFAALP